MSVVSAIGPLFRLQATLPPARMPGPGRLLGFRSSQGPLGEAVTGRIATGTFAMFMPPGSNTIRHNALRLLRAGWNPNVASGSER